ncbi:MAG: putative Ig domain-containing protein [Methanolobus sp.]
MTVTNKNRAPTLLLDPEGVSVAETETATITLTGSDPDGDDVTYSASGLPEGAIFDESSGIFTWTPD